MGIFSSQKKTVVATQAQRVIKDKDVPNSVKTGLIKAIFENGDKVEYIMDEMANSIGNRAERMYEYGRKDDGYMFGNPMSSIVSPVTGNQTITNYLRRIAGQDIAMNYLHFGAKNAFHFGYTKITVEYGYNVATNEFSYRPPTLEDSKYPVYLDSMVVYVHQDTFDNNTNSHIFDIWGPDPNGSKTPERYFAENMGSTAWKRRPYVEIIPDSQAEYMEVNMIWEHKWYDTSAEAYQAEYKYHTVRFVGLWDEGEFYQALYNQADGKYVFWEYRNGSGNAELDAVFFEENPKNEAGSFFPWIYFRYDKKNPLDNEESKEVKESRKMCKYLGVSFDMIVDAVHENPDAKDVEQAIMMMCVPANTENQMEQRYLFEFFDQMNLLADLPNPAFMGATNGVLFNQGDVARRSIIIEDKRFKTALGFNYMKKILVRQKGEVGKFSSGTDFDDYKYQTSDKDGAILTHTLRMRYHWYRKQITETQCEEIRIGNLRMTYYIYGQYSDTGNDEEEILLVPIDRSITRKYSTKYREELYARSLHFIFNTRQIITLKWYQREWFQIFLVVVTIVIAVLTWGQSLAANLTALSAGTLAISMAIQMTIVAALKYLAAMVALKLFIKAVGGEAALFLALVALAWGIKNGGAFLGRAAAEGAATWATNLVQTATSLIGSVGNYYSSEVAKIAAEISALGAQYEEDMAAIETAQGLLDNQTILQPISIFGETPNQYYYRTISAGNVGALSLDFPRTYVDQALTLPDFSTSIQEDI